MKVIKAPNFYNREKKSVFLAGSIEMGKAVDWQKQVTDALSHCDVQILNPRRDDWDSSWSQTKDNDKFREQVEWELIALEDASVIAMYFDPETKSPISLLELGIHTKDRNKLIVCCPEGFWRKGNVDIVCEHYGIRQVDTIEELIRTIKGKIF